MDIQEFGIMNTIFFSGLAIYLIIVVIRKVKVNNNMSVASEPKNHDKKIYNSTSDSLGVTGAMILFKLIPGIIFFGLGYYSWDRIDPINFGTFVLFLFFWGVSFYFIRLIYFYILAMIVDI